MILAMPALGPAPAFKNKWDEFRVRFLLADVLGRDHFRVFPCWSYVLRGVYCRPVKAD